MDIRKELTDLEEQGVFINLSYDHYTNGSNCLFYIEFHKTDNETCAFGDNHEFGDVADALEAAIKIAKWFLIGDRLKIYFRHVSENISEEGMKKWSERLQIQDELRGFMVKEFPPFKKLDDWCNAPFSKPSNEK